MIEWAVLRDIGEIEPAIEKAGLGSREEAEAWVRALTLTKQRENAIFKAMSSFGAPILFVGWRETATWNWNGAVNAED
jgi:hypothetical protein